MRAFAKRAPYFGRTSSDGSGGSFRKDRQTRAAVSNADGQRLLRLGRRVRSVRGSFEDRRGRAEKRNARTAVGQSDAASRADTGGHAQRDRFAESRNRLVSRARGEEV